MRVLVTGATGYIGRVVCARLLADGDYVLGMARTQEKAEQLQQLGIEPVLCKQGILDEAALRATSSADAVLDASSNRSRDSTQAVVDALSRSDSKRIYIATTGTIFYGHTGGKEGATEEWPCNLAPHTLPTWPKQKRDALEGRVCKITGEMALPGVEHVLLAEAAAAGVQGCIVRPPYVYGNGERGIGGGYPNDVPTAAKKNIVHYIGEGTQLMGTVCLSSRDNPYLKANPLLQVHVDDLAELYALLLHHSGTWTAGSSFIGSSGHVRQRDVAEAAAKHVGCECVALALAEAQAQMGYELADAMDKIMRVSGLLARCTPSNAPASRSHRPPLAVHITSRHLLRCTVETDTHTTDTHPRLVPYWRGNPADTQLLKRSRRSGRSLPGSSGQRGGYIPALRKRSLKILASPSAKKCK
jgi:nucleoside-diphosphate-sugar epimerase